MAWAPDYASTADLAAYLRIEDAVDDVELALAVTASSRSIDLHTNRQYGLVAAAEERTYPARYDRRRCRWVVVIDDLMTTTGLVVAGVAYDADLHRLEPLNAAVTGRPWTLLVLDTSPGDEVVIEARWGWTAVPTAIEQATLLQAARLFKRRDAPFGIAGSPESGSEMRLLARVDPDVAVTLGPYVRWWAAA